jgi:hypothetical protein
MTTQLYLARGTVEGRAHRWQDMTSLRTSGLTLSERRKSRAREDRKH